MGKLYDMNLSNYKEPGLLDGLDPNVDRRQALRETIDDALWYLSERTQTLTKVSRNLKETLPDIARNFTSPNNICNHTLGGRTEGYIQFPGDSDTTGRHDHLLTNAAGSASGPLGHFATIIYQFFMGEDSPTDQAVNGLGRQLGMMTEGDGVPFASGQELAVWIMKNLCDESKATCTDKGLNWDRVPMEKGN
jgi:hypothetical protein